MADGSPSPMVVRVNMCVIYLHVCVRERQQIEAMPNPPGRLIGPIDRSQSKSRLLYAFCSAVFPSHVPLSLRETLDHKTCRRRWAVGTFSGERPPFQRSQARSSTNPKPHKSGHTGLDHFAMAPPSRAWIRLARLAAVLGGPGTPPIGTKNNRLLGT
jgi:hypothetical protein